MGVFSDDALYHVGNLFFSSPPSLIFCFCDHTSARFLISVSGLDLTRILISTFVVSR